MRYKPVNTVKPLWTLCLQTFVFDETVLQGKFVHMGRNEQPESIRIVFSDKSIVPECMDMDGVARELCSERSAETGDQAQEIAGEARKLLPVTQ